MKNFLQSKLISKIKSNNLARLRINYHIDDDLQNDFLLLNSADFKDDKSKIIFSNSFRKLAYKTQVFFNNQGDYNRTRLTHSLEVAEIAYCFANVLGLNPMLSECIALAHDLGHTPFGHSGEDGLNIALKNLGLPSFNHNFQSLKIVTLLEKKYPSFLGLNLSWPIIDGLLKHNGPVSSKENVLIEQICSLYKLNPGLQGSLEAQVASIADDIAYTSHDLEDGWREKKISFEEIKNLPIIIDFFEQNYPNVQTDIKNLDGVQKNLQEKQIVYQAIQYLANFMMIDVIENIFSQVEKNKISSVEDVYNFDKSLAEFSLSVKQKLLIIRQFLFKKYYRHPEILSKSMKMQNIIKDLFNFYWENIECLPYEWQDILQKNQDIKHEIICDFIAGMTDRYAINLFQSIFQ